MTLFDVYECAINPDLVEQKIQEGDRLFERRYILITLDDFMADAHLEQYPFERDAEAHLMKAHWSEELEGYLKDRKISYELEIKTGETDGTSPAASDEKSQQFEAVKRWFYHDWKRIDLRLRTSIVEGISVFLSLFDDNPAVKRVFCPPKETYDPVANRDGALGRPLPPFREPCARSTFLSRRIRAWRR